MVRPTDTNDPDDPLAPKNDDRRLDRFLGNKVRELRQRNHLTLGDVATQAGISQGMLSKIENGQASMSMDTLSKVANALGAQMSELFRNYNTPSGGAQLVKGGDGMEVVRRGTKRGHTYHLLAYDKGPRRAFEPFLVTLNDESEVFPSFEHEGTEFIYILAGRIEYRHGQETYMLEPGDAITFQGDVPHGPERIIETPVQMLSVIVYSDIG